MTRSDAATLLPLAESIADGSAIDWEVVEASAGAQDKAVIRQLRVLSNLAGLHRSLPADPSDAGVSVARQAAAAPAIGSWAHLSLIARLGGGTFGEVYRAWDRHLEREVALKLLKVEEASGDLGSSRIATEGRLLARIDHPNVITVHGVAVHDQRVGLWMELVRGVTLEQQLSAQGPFSAREAALIGIDLCHALAAIHAAGLIHRDVKAQNVMRADGGRIVLMDLGTGREADQGGRREISDMAGTPLYIAPEIFAGAVASDRTDLYSLGVLLYHLVTASFPVRATTIDELRDGHAKGKGVRLRDARADLPTAFVRVVDRATAKDPARRYESAGALEADLLHALDEAAVPVPVATPRRIGLWPMAALAAAAVIALMTIATPAIIRRLAPPPVHLGARDTILVADFTNSTGEAVFDGTLKEALTVQLQQSPYLNALGASGVDAGLRMMGRPAGTKLSGPVARELCERRGMKAMILGSIASLGNQYVVTVQALNCQTGAPIAEGHVEATSRNGVLSALGAATVGLREKLGESLASIQQFNVQVEDATTGSLDALKAYSLGLETRAKTGEAEAIPFFNHALELDPNFALAEGRLAAIYANLHELEQSKLHTQKAFELSTHVTERERLYIRGSYHLHVTGRLDEAIGAYRLWTQLYPQDWTPHQNLGAMLGRIGRFDESLREAETARTLGPDQAAPYEELAELYLTMERLVEAKETVGLAKARGIETAPLRTAQLQIALIEGGTEAVRKTFESMNKSATDYVIVAAAAQAEAFGGDFPAARSLLAQAMAQATSVRMNDYAATLIAEDAVRAALAGEARYAQEALDRALAIGRGSETLWAGSLANAFSGRRKAADQLMDEYLRLTPPTTDVVVVSGPVLRAASALAGGEYQRAIEALQPALPYDRIGRFWPAYIRGLAYLGLKKPQDATAQFQTILAHRGDDPDSVLFPLARVQLARARRAAGDVPGARAAFDGFITGWSEAPRDQPALAAAIRERSRLPR